MFSHLSKILVLKVCHHHHHRHPSLPLYNSHHLSNFYHFQIFVCFSCHYSGISIWPFYLVFSPVLLCFPALLSVSVYCLYVVQMSHWRCGNTTSYASIAFAVLTSYDAFNYMEHYSILYNHICLYNCHFSLPTIRCLRLRRVLFPRRIFGFGLLRRLRNGDFLHFIGFKVFIKQAGDPRFCPICFLLVLCFPDF